MVSGPALGGVTGEGEAVPVGAAVGVGSTVGFAVWLGCGVGVTTAAGADAPTEMYVVENELP